VPGNRSLPVEEDHVGGEGPDVDPGEENPARSHSVLRSYFREPSPSSSP